MKRAALPVLVLLTVLFLPLVQANTGPGGAGGLQTTLNADEVKATIRQVADYQLAHRVNYPPEDWTMAPLYDGLIDTSLVLGDPKYLAPVIRAGREALYEPGQELSNADSFAVGQSWLRIYLMDPERNPEVLTVFVDRFNEILSSRKRSGWSWTDALYMAPPTIVTLGQATGDSRYLDLAYREVRATYDSLYDQTAHLFYRDTRYIGQRTPNGQKVFWSRGNGWAYAGLAKVLERVPAGDPSRAFYLQVFTEMSQALLQTQQADGLWYPSLLDPGQVPIGETSGSALFLYGMAWGVDQGVLDPATYLPAIECGWKGLLTRILPTGEVNYVQPIAAAPKPFDPRNSDPWGTGAVLGAGSEILRVLNADASVDPAALRADAEVLADSARDLSSFDH